MLDMWKIAFGVAVGVACGIALAAMVPVIAPVVLTLAALGAVLIFLICLVSLWMDRMGVAKAARKPSPTPAMPERLRRSRKEAQAAWVKAQYGDFKRSKS